MHDLVLFNNVNQVTFKNKELEELVQRIIGHSSSIQESIFQIALELKYIKDYALYSEDGYKTIEDFAKKVLNYGKATTYSLLKIAENYLVWNEENYEVKTIFAQGDRDFSVNQLREVISLDKSEVEELVESDKINPFMTVRQIREVVAKAKVETEKKDNQINLFDSVDEKTSSDVGTEENQGINSSESSLLSSSEISSQIVENASETLSAGSLVSNYQSDNSDGLEVLSRLLDDDSMEEEYPFTPYEFRFYNYRQEKSETKAIDQIELSELIDDSVVLPKELTEYISLLNKEIKRLNHFSRIESARLDELDKEVTGLKEDNTRLQEENDRLVHPAPKKRGRPLGSKNIK